MAYKVTSAPAEEPISLAEAKNWLKAVGTADDTIISMLISAERGVLEDKLNQKLVTQTIEEKQDKFPLGNEPIYLAANPVQSITSIVYKDAASSTAVLSTDVYELDNTSERARIYLKEGQTWPVTISEKERVSITYVAGYGAASAVPDKLKKILYHMIGYAYENRMNPVEQKRTYLDRLIGLEKVSWFE